MGTRGAPPPPPTNKRPSQPPPPPPTRDLPPPPPSHGSSEPPTPPMRRESINRAGPGSSGYNSSASSGGESFEARFSGKFRSMQYLPPPEPFNRCQKTYPSKTTVPVRQGSQLKRTPAPPPPPGKPPLPPAPPPTSRAWATATAS